MIKTHTMSMRLNKDEISMIDEIRSHLQKSSIGVVSRAEAIRQACELYLQQLEKEKEHDDTIIS